MSKDVNEEEPWSANPEAAPQYLAHPGYAPGPQGCYDAHTVQLILRRRGWIRVTLGSLMICTVYFIAEAYLFNNTLGIGANTARFQTLAFEIFLALLIISMIILAISTIMSISLRRIPVAARKRAHAMLSQRSLTAADQTYNYPQPQYRANWLLGFLALALIAFPAVTYAPHETDEIAYVIGIGQYERSYAQATIQVCGRSGCSILSRVLLADGTVVYMPGRVSNYGSSVLEPIWTWGTGSTLAAGLAAAWEDLRWGLVFDLCIVPALILSLRSSGIYYRATGQTGPDSQHASVE